MNVIEIKLLVTNLKQEAVTALVSKRSNELLSYHYLHGCIDAYQRLLDTIKEIELKEREHDIDE
jgi:hypothetical protein